MSLQMEMARAFKSANVKYWLVLLSFSLETKNPHREFDINVLPHSTQTLID